MPFLLSPARLEAESVDAAVLFANSAVDCVQLDHLAPEQVAEAVWAIGALDRRPTIAVTGGIIRAMRRPMPRPGRICWSPPPPMRRRRST